MTQSLFLTAPTTNRRDFLLRKNHVIHANKAHRTFSWAFGQYGGDPKRYSNDASESEEKYKVVTQSFSSAHWAGFPAYAVLTRAEFVQV